MKPNVDWKQESQWKGELERFKFYFEKLTDPKEEARALADLSHGLTVAGRMTQSVPAFERINETQHMIAGLIGPLLTDTAFGTVKDHYSQVVGGADEWTLNLLAFAASDALRRTPEVRAEYRKAAKIVPEGKAPTAKQSKQIAASMRRIAELHPLPN